MPRIRTIKPELPQNERLAACSVTARYLYVMLITQADDEGRMRGAPALVKGACLPYDELISSGEVDELLDELHAREHIARYVVDEQAYLVITGWSTHQQINKPTPSRLPAPTRENTARAGDPRISPGIPGKPGLRARAPDLGSRIVDLGSEEGAIAPVALDERRREREDVEAVFAAWVASTGRSRTHLDEKRRRLIRKALDAYPLQDVIAAVDGWRHSAHHRGENDRDTVYNDLSLLLRNGEHIERFRDYTLGVLAGRGTRGPDNAARVEQLLQGMRPAVGGAPAARQLGTGDDAWNA